MRRARRVKLASFCAVAFAANGAGCLYLALSVAPRFFVGVAICGAVAGWLTLEAIASASGSHRRDL